MTTFLICIEKDGEMWYNVGNDKERLYKNLMNEVCNGLFYV